MDQLVGPQVPNRGEGLPAVTLIWTLAGVGPLVGLEVAAGEEHFRAAQVRARVGLLLRAAALFHRKHRG